MTIEGRQRHSYRTPGPPAASGSPLTLLRSALIPLDDSSMLKDVRSCLLVPEGQGRRAWAETQGAVKTLIFHKMTREREAQHLRGRKSTHLRFRQTGIGLTLWVSGTLREPRCGSPVINQHIKEAALDFCSYSDSPALMDGSLTHLVNHAKTPGINLDSSLSPIPFLTHHPIKMVLPSKDICKTVSSPYWSPSHPHSPLP